MSKRWNSQSASSALTTRPPANESTAKSVASLMTVWREGPSGATALGSSALVHLAMRWGNRSTLPSAPNNLKPWEKLLSKIVHRAIMVLTMLVPMLGYAMSSSYTQSDGVPFFFFGHLPEVLPKNDAAFEVFDALHTYTAYTLLGLVVLHVAGALKHRLTDKGGESDVLSRMV